MKKQVKKKNKDNGYKYLIFIGIVIIGIAAYFAYNNNIHTPLKDQNSQDGETQDEQKNATSILTLVKHPNENKVDVMMDTGSQTTSAVQIDISFDPKVLTNVQVDNGSFFDTPTVLANKVNANTGDIFYAAAIPVNTQEKSGQGIIATISYTPSAATGSQTELKFLPKTKITTNTFSSSILKQSTGITISL